jgi:hypothetical protein
MIFGGRGSGGSSLVVDQEHHEIVQIDDRLLAVEVGGSRNRVPIFLLVFCGPHRLAGSQSARTAPLLHQAALVALPRAPPVFAV